MQRCGKMEGILREVSPFCPAGYKFEIEKALGLVHIEESSASNDFYH
jgi:hypothetical protein